MFEIAVLLAVVALSPEPQARAQATDTSIAVEKGSKLRVRVMGGDIRVRTWDRAELRVQAEHSRRVEVVLARSGSVVDVSARGGIGPVISIDYEITAPTWMALELGGMHGDVTVEGTQASVRVETLEGNIHLKGGSDRINLSTTNGNIEVVGARGNLDLQAVSSDIIVSDVEGNVVAETVSGNVELRDIKATTVEAQTVSGDVIFAGSVEDRGTYELFTHSGDIIVGIPDRSNALVTTSTTSGDVTLGFEMRNERTTKHRRVYRLGNGSATVDLETYSGDIHIVDRADVASRRARRPEADEKTGRKRVRRSLEEHDSHDSWRKQ